MTATGVDVDDYDDCGGARAAATTVTTMMRVILAAHKHNYRYFGCGCCCCCCFCLRLLCCCCYYCNTRIRSDEHFRSAPFVLNVCGNSGGGCGDDVVDGSLERILDFTACTHGARERASSGGKDERRSGRERDLLTSLLLFLLLLAVGLRRV